jgi:D-3-phosphoglycerate dehydrogenase
MMVWNGGPETLAPLLHSRVRWVQIGSAGIENWLASGIIDDSRTWMCGTAIYSEPVAEHAMALILAGRRRLAECARATGWDPTLVGLPLHGCVVLIVGAGGIGTALIRMLAPFGATSVAVTRSAREVANATRSASADALTELWGEADIVVLAAPATSASHRIVNARTLAAMREHVLLVNVARGALVDTDALVDALRHDRVGGAALDATDPEPLPAGHPLWTDPRVLITPHTANPVALRTELLARRVTENVQAIVGGRTPASIIEPARGY